MRINTLESKGHSDPLWNVGQSSSWRCGLCTCSVTNLTSLCPSRRYCESLLRKSTLTDMLHLGGQKSRGHWKTENWKFEGSFLFLFYTQAFNWSCFFYSWTVGRVGVTSNTSVWQISAYKILTCYISLTIWDLIMLPAKIQVQIPKDLFAICAWVLQNLTVCLPTQIREIIWHLQHAWFYRDV